jgi:hypothetical protein
MQSQEQQLLMELRNLTLSHQEKRLIRQRIQTKQQKSLNIQKVFRAIRYTGYASVGIFGLFVLASSFLPQQQRISDSTNPLITLLTPWSQTVKADTLWRLVTIQWVVNISDNGNILPNTEIHAWQTVVLEPWAQLVVQLMGTTFATISGPATFVLEKLPETNQTVLNMLEWSLIEVSTKVAVANDNSKKTASTTPESSTEITQAQAVIIKTKHVQVTTNPQESATFVINQNEQSADVLATAWNVIVKQLLANNTTDELIVQSWNNAHIDNTWIAIKLPESTQELEQLAAVSKNLQIRYQKSINPEKNENAEPSILAYLDDPESVPLRVEAVWEDILEELNMKTRTVATKRIIPNNLRIALENNINDFETIYSETVNKQIAETYILLWLNTPIITDLQSAQWAITQLIATLKNTYSVPPSLITSLNNKIALITWSQTIKNEHEVAATVAITNSWVVVDVEITTVVTEPTTPIWSTETLSQDF